MATKRRAVSSSNLRRRSQPHELKKSSLRAVPAQPSILPAPGTNLLGLVMIVKNEAHGIEQTLYSFRPFIESWTILDTGSTDDTQGVIRHALKGVPGQLFEEPFVDFSTSRNRALELHGTQTTFTIMPDSDDRLGGGVELRNFLVEQQESFHDAYRVNIRRGELSYFLPLVLRTTAGWRYSGRVHEAAGKPNCSPAEISIPSVTVSQERVQRSLEASKARWVRDLRLLQEDFDANPDPRTAFYLAQTLDCLGRTEEALAAYQKRIDMGGWFEETFEAKLRRGHMLKRLGRPWPDVQQAYLDAHAFSSSRAEPLYAIADHYYYHAKDNLPLTFLYARRAAELPLPDTTLFVDREIYDWKAAHLTAIAGYYLGDREREIGAACASKAIAACPDHELLRNNRSFYARSAADTFGATLRRLNFEPEKPFVAANPSVHFDGETWRCIVRTLNYKIIDGYSYQPPDGIIQTHNVMLELTADQEIARTIKMRDLAGASRTDYPVHGFEDCRLFDVDGRFYCTATVCDFSTKVYGLREIVVLELDRNYSIIRATPIRGSWSAANQKNWMPLAESPKGLAKRHTKIIYSLIDSNQDPAISMELDVGGSAKLDGELRSSNPHLRGGSQLVSIAGGYLCLIHDVTFSEALRTYLHRFVWLDDKFVMRKMSDLFFFQKRGIEYCAGLAHDGGGKLVASYSVNDASAHLATFDVDRVLSALRSDFVV